MLVEASKHYPSVSITDDGLLWSGPRMNCRIVRCVFGCQASHVRREIIVQNFHSIGRYANATVAKGKYSAEFVFLDRICILSSIPRSYCSAALHVPFAVSSEPRVYLAYATVASTGMCSMVFSFLAFILATACCILLVVKLYSVFFQLFDCTLRMVPSFDSHPHPQSISFVMMLRRILAEEHG